jgi:CubicO group peptidase (beta-lactamase class C family)
VTCLHALVRWGGWGGSLVVIDPDARMAVAYVTKQMCEPADDTRGMELVMAAYDGLPALPAGSTRR